MSYSLPIIQGANDFYQLCALGEQYHHPIPKERSWKATTIMELILTNMHRPMKTPFVK